MINLQNSLLDLSYKVGHYRQFYVLLPKKRLIMDLEFKDRIVQWAIYQLINPMYERKFYYHSYACRVNKGRDKAVNVLQNWIRLNERAYGKSSCYLKLDVSKYFYRINHEVLLNILKRDFPNDPNLITIFEKIINCPDVAFGLPKGKSIDDVSIEDRLFDVGMPIGNLMSQLLANVCLNELDMFVKHTLKVNKYIRYMDDMIILSNDFILLNHYKNQIEKYLNETLKLDLNSKTAINYTYSGITFLGIRVYSTHRKMAKKSLNQMKTRLRYIASHYDEGLVTYEQIKSTLTSYRGQLKQCNSEHLKEWILRNIKFNDVKCNELIRNIFQMEGEH